MKRLATLREWVTENLEGAHQRQASNYNLRRRPRTFVRGDLVLRKQRVLSNAAQNFAAKLAPKFEGPFRIEKKLSSVVYELIRLDGSLAGKVHVQDLKPYYPPDPN